MTAEILKEEIITEDDKYIASYINDIEEYKSFMFEDHDFLNVPEICKLYLNNPSIVKKILHIDIKEYMDLMPSDIKSQMEIHKYREDTSFDEEEMIIKSIDTIIKLLEINPILLKKTSETELSDHIFRSLFLPLSESGIVVAREMPAGYANKTVGELDFCMYSKSNNVFRVVAIGENKEWGKYAQPIKQLIGYMNKDCGFGFSILFNKKTQLKTVIKKRRSILESFYVETDGAKYFETQQIEEEPFNLKGVVTTLHINPETGDLFKVYHFIVNCHSPERLESAKQARIK